MIKAGIVGGDSNEAGELVRLLVNHPDVELRWVNSVSNSGRRIDSVHRGLVGDLDLSFTAEMPFDKVDVVFLCNAHGKSKKMIEAGEIPDGVKIVDLSDDYRIAFEESDFVYGLPELNRKYIIRANHVANPGSVATAVLLGLLPLAKNLLLNSDLHIAAITSTSEAAMGASVADNNLLGGVSLYAPFHHRDLAEIRQSLTALQRSFASPINLIPTRGGFTRGTLVSTYMDCHVELPELLKLYDDYYDDHNFTYVVDCMPELADVVNTNKCLLHLEKEGDKLLVVSVIDNVLKGVAGQAVHNMNLLFGLHERTGLQLKASVF